MEFNRQVVFKTESHDAEAGGAVCDSGVSLNEEVFLSQLHCRSVLLNDEFQNAVRNILIGHRISIVTDRMVIAQNHSSEGRHEYKSPGTRDAMKPIFNSRSGSCIDQVHNPRIQNLTGSSSSDRTRGSKIRTMGSRWPVHGVPGIFLRSTASNTSDTGDFGLAHSPSLSGSGFKSKKTSRTFILSSSFSRTCSADAAFSGKFVGPLSFSRTCSADAAIARTSLDSSRFSRTCSADAAFAGVYSDSSSFSRTCSADDSLLSREAPLKDSEKELRHALPRTQLESTQKPYAAPNLEFQSGHANNTKDWREPFTLRQFHDDDFAVSIFPAPVKTMVRMREKVR